MRKVLYRGTSLIRDTPLLGPYSRSIPRVIWWSCGCSQQHAPSPEVLRSYAPLPPAGKRRDGATLTPSALTERVFFIDNLFAESTEEPCPCLGTEPRPAQAQSNPHPAWVQKSILEVPACSRDTHPESYITKYTSIRRWLIETRLFSG